MVVERWLQVFAMHHAGRSGLDREGLACQLSMFASNLLDKLVNSDYPPSMRKIWLESYRGEILRRLLSLSDVDRHGQAVERPEPIMIGVTDPSKFKSASETYEVDWRIFKARSHLNQEPLDKY